MGRRQREYSLAEIAVLLQRSVEQLITAKCAAGILPTRRDAAGQPFFDQRGLSLFHRLLVEGDATALLEAPDEDAMRRYVLSQLSEENRRLVRRSDDYLSELLHE